MKLKVPSKFKCKLVPPSHEVSVTPFLLSAPPKMRLHPPNYSHSLFNIHTSYNYTKVIQMMLFYLMLDLAPHGLDLGFGLEPHLLQRLIRRTLNTLTLVHFFY